MRKGDASEKKEKKKPVVKKARKRRRNSSSTEDNSSGDEGDFGYNGRPSRASNLGLIAMHDEIVVHMNHPHEDVGAGLQKVDIYAVQSPEEKQCDNEGDAETQEPEEDKPCSSKSAQ